MAKVKYKNISKELLKMASSNNMTDDNYRSSINNVIDVVEHYRLDIEKLIPYHKQARKIFIDSELEGLIQSIKEHGIRQPLTIIQSKLDIDKYEVISGERRLRAAKIAGIKKVPCIIISDHLLAEEIALVENIQRQDLHPIELGEAFMNILKSRKEWTQHNLAEKLGISNKLISENIKYAKLPNEVKKNIISNNIKNRDFLRKLLKANNPIELLEKQQKISFLSSIKSVLRISLLDGKFHIQSNSINKIDEEYKFELKKLLADLINKI